uniref:Putative radical SAM superfamily protein n=1 Tax=viral metagenome TaxID=1070528 RepID=A0A6M3IFQ8_9ZZZZ
MLDLVLIELPNPALESPKMYFALGNLYLAAAVKKAGFSVMIADFRDGVRTLPEARYYGFSCTTPQVPIAKQIAKTVKGKKIIGGAHPSLLPEDCRKEFDYVVRGEGEEVLVDILRNKYRTKIITASRIERLDTVPLPAWDLVDDCFSDTLFEGERYGKGEKSMAMITSRGCPFSCSFCGNHLRTPVTFRSVRNIQDEIVALEKRGVKHLRFVDDNFTLHPEFENVCRVLKDNGVKYRCHTRSNLLTLHKARWLKGTGCEECSIGVESADNKVLKKNHKGETVIQHGRAIQMLQEAGIVPKTYWMSGLPGETDKTIELNKEFMRKYKPAKWTLSTFTPYPGCDIYQNPAKYGVKIINEDWTNWWNFVFNVRGLDLPGRAGYVHQLKGQTLEEMKARHDEFYYFLTGESWKK